MTLTTDPNDPRLKKGVGSEEGGQDEVHLVLSKKERAKGFIRPLRHSYIHSGKQPKYSLRDLDEDELERHKGCGYVKYEEYPESESPICGRFWTQKGLDKMNGCGTITKMTSELAETHARDPKFYGGTYCVGCQEYLSVEEFKWLDGEGMGT